MRRQDAFVVVVVMRRKKPQCCRRSVACVCCSARWEAAGVVSAPVVVVGVVSVRYLACDATAPTSSQWPRHLPQAATYDVVVVAPNFLRIGGQSRGWRCAGSATTARRWASSTSPRCWCWCRCSATTAAAMRRHPSAAWCVGAWSASRSQCRRGVEGSWAWRRRCGPKTCWEGWVGVVCRGVWGVGGGGWVGRRWDGEKG